MINAKYYNDIKRFPDQFQKGFDLAEEVKIDGVFKDVTLCGMGGSSFFVPLINDMLATDPSVKFSMDVVKGYDLPEYTSTDNLYLVSSYSGNTEEVISFYDQIIKKQLPHIVITTGGELERLAVQNGSPLYKIPGGIQPRLSTGYFIAGIVQILINCNIIPSSFKDLMINASKTIGSNFNEEDTKYLAKELMNMVPIIYSTDNNSSLACLSKIKFNENCKIQSFWNYFPELNHNEMVGFTMMLMKCHFIIFQSQFTNTRNLKRIEVFRKLMNDKGLKTYLFELKGDNVLEEIFMGYYFIDHVTYYLAEGYGIDPEPVVMVETFKEQIEH